MRPCAPRTSSALSFDFLRRWDYFCRFADKTFEAFGERVALRAAREDTARTRLRAKAIGLGKWGCAPASSRGRRRASTLPSGESVASSMAPVPRPVVEKTKLPRL